MFNDCFLKCSLVHWCTACPLRVDYIVYYFTVGIFNIWALFPETIQARSDATKRLKNVSQDTQEILEEFSRTYKEDEKKDEGNERVADKFNAVTLLLLFFFLL